MAASEEARITHLDSHLKFTKHKFWEKLTKSLYLTLQLKYQAKTSITGFT